jgi:hypothetical protein
LCVLPPAVLPNRHQPVAQRTPLIANGFCVQCQLLKEDCLRVADVHARISRTCCHRTAVVAEVESIHPFPITIEPALPQASGGGNSATSDGGVENGAVAGVVGEVHIRQHIQEGDGMRTHPQRQEAPPMPASLGVPAPWS